MRKRNLIVVVAMLLTVVLASSYKTTDAITVYTTRILESTTSDGYIDEHNSNYTLARNDAVGIAIDSIIYGTCGQYPNNTGIFTVTRTFLYFDTSMIPADANYSSAILSIHIENEQSVIDFNVTIQSGQPTYPHDPMVGADFLYTHYSGDGGSRNTSTIPGETYWNITLNSQGIGWINEGGTTKLCLRSSRDINAIMPDDTNNEFITHYMAEKGAGYVPKLYLSYSTDSAYLYRLYGAYDEDGFRDGAINITFYRPEEVPLSFELDGQYNATSEADTRMVFHFDLGNNNSRVYYVKDTYEDIYVFKPTEPYTTYTFAVVDYVGITNGYLETLINVNGTNRVVERWSLSMLNDIPFTLSWARSYDIRLVCDEGTYTWAGFVALEDTTQTLVIVPGMFPITYPGLVVSVNASRMNATYIQMNYTDTQNLTSWVKTDILHLENLAWETDYTTNNTGYTQQVNWYSAVSTVDYVTRVTALYDGETKTWTFQCGRPADEDYVWEGIFDSLGTFPFPARNIIGLCIVLGVFAVFSYFYLPLGCVLGVLLASFLTIIAWLDINWNFIALAFGVAIFVGISRAKRVEREI